MDIVFVALLFGLPLGLTLLLKVNAGVLFFAGCSGIVLLSSLDQTFVAAAGAVVPGDGEAIVRLLVVLGTIAIASLGFQRAVSGIKIVLHALLALLTGAVLWLELPRLTGVSGLVNSRNSELWQLLADFQSPIIAIGIALSLLLLLSKQHGFKKAKHH